jgi:hypothetical protein
MIYPELREASYFIQSDRTICPVLDLLPISIKQDGSASKVPRSDNNFYEHVALAVLVGTARKFDRTVTVQLIVGAIDSRRQCLTEPTAQFSYCSS